MDKMKIPNKKSLNQMMGLGSKSLVAGPKGGLAGVKGMTLQHSVNTFDNGAKHAQKVLQ